MDIIQAQERLGIGAHDVVEAVSALTGVPCEAILSEKRGQEHVANARQICMAVCVEDLGMKTEAVGAFFGGRLHSAVSHAVRTVRNRADVDEEFARLRVYARMAVNDQRVRVAESEKQALREALVGKTPMEAHTSVRVGDISVPVGVKRLMKQEARALGMGMDVYVGKLVTLVLRREMERTKDKEAG